METIERVSGPYPTLQESGRDGRRLIDAGAYGFLEWLTNRICVVDRALALLYSAGLIPDIWQQAACDDRLDVAR